jgi:Uma2 family endonuclease
MVQHNARIGLSDFVEQYSRQPFELVNGEVIALSPNVSGHQWVSCTPFRLPDQFLQEHPIREVLWETPFVLSDNPDWVRDSYTPDLAFYTAQRRADYVKSTPDWKEKPIVLVPDLVVEIVSPHDRYTDINDKVDRYLAEGVQSAWVLEPQCRKVVIHHTDSDQQTTLRENAILIGDPLLPGFKVPVRALFE